MMMSTMLLTLMLAASTASTTEQQRVFLTPNLISTVDLLNGTTYQLIINSSFPNTSFYIYEVHTQSMNLTLIRQERKVIGNHVGLAVNATTLQEDAVVYLNVPPPLLSSSSRKALFLVRGPYSTEHYPVPGQDLEFNSSKSFISLSYDQDVIRAEFTPSLASSFPDLTYRLYHHYFPEEDTSENTFLLNLKTMLTVDGILSNGRLIDSGYIGRGGRVTFANYPGTGRVVGIILSSGNFSINYVSTATYGRDIREYPVQSNLTKVLMACVLFLGLFMCIYGHRFFLCSQFIYGSLCGAFITYILAHVFLTQDKVIIGVAVGGSIVGGLLWSGLWFAFGLPILSMVLTGFAAGLLLACMAMFVTINNLLFFATTGNYWYTFSGIIGLTPVVLICLTKYASILTSAFIGSFLIIMSVDFYAGTTIKYILINVIKRATVTDFNKAVMNPVFQTHEMAMMAAWIFICLFFIIFQHIRERHRAPFPASPFSQWMWRREEGDRIQENDLNNSGENETAPLLYDHLGRNTRIVGDAIYFDHRELQAANLPVVGYIAGRTNYGSMQRQGAGNDYDFQADLPSAPPNSVARSSTSLVSPRHTATPRNTPINRRVQPDIFKPPTPSQT